MLTCIRSKRQRDAAEYALRTIQSSCIRPYIKTIYLYGSCARGEEKYSSDVDLFLELSESFRSRPELKKYLYLLKSEVSSEELDDAETDLKIVVGDDWKRNKMLYYTNVRKEGIQIWPWTVILILQKMIFNILRKIKESNNNTL